jgi:translocation and assembly module TamB
MSVWAKLSSEARRRPILTAALALAAVLILALAGIFLALQTRAGRDVLARMIEKQLSEPGGISVDIGRLEGRLPYDIRIDRIAVADAKGEWLSAGDIRIDWRPLSLFRGTLAIDSVRVGKAVVSRLPDTMEEGKTSANLPPLNLALDLLAVETVLLDEAVLGLTVSLRAEGSVAFSERTLEAALAVARTDGSEGGADLAFSYDADSRVLDLEGALVEPPGGLLARFVGLPGYPAVAFSISGEGPAGSWSGRLEAEIESLATTDLAVDIDLREGIRTHIDGSLQPGPELGVAALAALGRSTALSLDIQKPEGSDEIRVAVGRIASDAVAASGTAIVTWDDRHVRGDVAIDIVDATLLAPLFAPAALAAGSAAITFDGPLDRPTIQVHATVEHLAVTPVRARSSTVVVEITPDGPLNRPDLRIGLRGTAGMSEFTSGTRGVDRLLGPEPAVTFDVTAAPDDARVEVTALALQGSAGATRATGAVSLNPVSVSADGRLTIPDIAPLSDLVSRPLQGSIETGYAVAWAAGNDLELTLDGTLAELRTGIPVADTLLGSRVAVGGQLAVAPDGTLRADAVRISGSAVAVSGRIELPAGAATMSAEYAASVTDLVPLGLAAGARPGGRLEASGKVAGPLADPGIDGVATVHGLAAAGLTFDRMTLEYRVRNAASQPAGDLAFDGTAVLLPGLSGRLEFAKTKDTIRIDRLQASTRGTTVTGNLAVPLTGAAIAGRLQASAADLEPWSDIAGLALSGRAEASVRFAGEAGKQALQFDATGRNVKAGDAVLASRVELHVESVDPRGDGPIKVSAEARNVLVAGGELGELSVEASGTLVDAAVSLSAKGQLRGALDLSAAARIRRPGMETVITLNRLDGAAGGSAVTLSRPATIRIGPVTEIKGLALGIGEGQIDGDLSITEDQVALRLDARSIPLDVIAPALPPDYAAVTFDLRAGLVGPPAQLGGELELTAVGLAAGEIPDQPQGLSVTLKGTLRAETLNMTGNLIGLDEVRSSAEISLPVRVSLMPVQAAVFRARPIEGRLLYKGPIAPAWALAKLDRHRLAGATDIELHLSGALDKPVIDGQIGLTDGRYENLDTGTILSELVLSARPSQAAIVIDRATASDGDTGRVSASGRVEFGGPQNLAIDLAAQFEAARLVRRDELTAVVSGGIAVNGTASDRLISGRLEVQEAEVRLASGLPSGVVEIEVVETGAEAEAAVIAAPPRSPSLTRLDLQVDMPKRVFVRGRGLDSEWGGSLLIKGTTATPRIQGALRPLRGRYDFAGKIFALREGDIQFIGEKEINPVLDLSADLKTGDLTAIIRVTGTARRPEIQMESVPELPQDEVLSRVLFNKSTGRLSATEALRLSQAVATLSGGGGGVTDVARRLLNLDVLQFTGGDDDEEGSAQAGKYLSDKVFLGVKAGTSVGSSTATVEIEVSPRIKVEGTVGSSDKSEIGIKWKRDY